MPVAPNLLIETNVSYPTEYAYWEYDDGTGDPFYGSPYQWEMSLVCTPQAHNDYSTSTPFFYTAENVKVGDWIASGSNGKAMKIIQINAASGNNLVCIVEDYERYNLFTDPDQLGYGCIPDGNAIIFAIGEDGLPILGPLVEGFLGTTAVSNLQARFIGNNEAERVLVNQPGHTFEVGDVIYADFEQGSGYALVNEENFDRAIGVIYDIKVPGVDYFRYRPMGTLINDLSPPLWGDYGDMYYLDPTNPGKLTVTKPDDAACPIYLQLELPNKVVMLERGVERTSGNSGSQTYKYEVTEVSDGQTIFMLPIDAETILFMAINGIENENFTFDSDTKVLVFDPVATGYGVDSQDEVFFIYKN